mgnify:CR=1 FL=1
MIKIENVVSLFDGHSGLQIALKELGITPKNYFASEIDKHAIKATMQNFSNTIQLGSVVDIDVSKLPKIDLLSGGSPCQSFSFAGKRKGMSTVCETEILTLEHYLQLKSEGYEFEGQSYLFWEYMRVLTELRKVNPEILFLLENVEMGKKWEGVLSKAIGINGLHINSALVSAQNRERIYWVNWHTKKDGLFSYEYPNIPQPKDRGIFLKDILESEVDEKYYLSDKAISGMLSRIENHKEKGNGFGASFSDGTNKSNTISSRYYKDGSECLIKEGNHSDMDLIVQQGIIKFGRNEEGKAMRKESMKRGKDHTPFQAKEITKIDVEKSNTITSVQKDNLVLQINPSLESGGKQPYQQNRIYDSEGIAPALCANKSDLLILEKDGLGCDYRTDEGIRIRENGKSGTLQARARNDESCGQLAIQYPRIRRLTETECARLQTIPEWFSFEGISSTQIYRQVGNGWTIEVIKHLLSFLP